MRFTKGLLFVLISLPACGGAPAPPVVTETANPYVRYYAKVPRALSVPSLPEVMVDAGSTVMFQRIIHDGLVGHQFLHSHVVTFDLHDASMTFAPCR